MITIEKVKLGAQWATFAYLLSERHEPIVLVGFVSKSLVCNLYGFWIEPFNLQRRHVRPLLRIFRLAGRTMNLVANVECKNPKAIHLAKLFGFEEVERSGDVIIMERAQDK